MQGFVLPVGPVDTSTVTILDGEGNSVPASETWYVDPNCAEPRIMVEDRSKFEKDENIAITYSAGLASIPPDLMIAALELAAHHFENREATISGTIITPVPSSVWSIVANYGRGVV